MKKIITNDKKGISLIVLVITIIVIIILAGAVILNLTKNNPINSAKIAKIVQEKESLESSMALYITKQIANTLGEYSSSDIIKGTVSGMTELVDTTNGIKIDTKEIYPSKVDAIKNNLDISLSQSNAKWYIEPSTGKFYLIYDTSSDYDTWMGTYNPTTKVIDNSTLSSFVFSKETSEPIVNVVATLPDGTGYIPQGFRYLEGTIDTGYVITDAAVGMSNGNEYVWIPVVNIADFKRTDFAKENGSYADYSEPEDTTFKTSVETYKGFYIARYEAGDGITTSARTNSTSDTNTVVSKKGAYVYNYVTRDQSKTLAESAVSLTDGTKSKLMSSYAWDTLLNWIQAKGYSVTNSVSWGNYINSTGAAATNCGVVQTSGKNEAWKAQNIYDLAGNLWEWTTEICSVVTAPCVSRTSSFGFNGSTYPASYRGTDTLTFSHEYAGFRVMLYK